MAKGSRYERDICRQLSMWWTGMVRDDIFWRSSASGARATMRSRAGKATAGQYGDVAATDPIGAPLIDVFTIEIKRGYSGSTVQDILDREDTAAQQEYERFFAQAIESYEAAGSLSWLLITRRDRRRAMVWMPLFIFKMIMEAGGFVGLGAIPEVRMRVRIRHDKGTYCKAICGILFDQFLTGVTPAIIKGLSV